MERLTNLLKIKYLVSWILSLNTKTHGSYLGFFPVYQAKAPKIAEHHQLSLGCHKHRIYIQPSRSRCYLTRDCILTAKALAYEECSTKQRRERVKGEHLPRGSSFSLHCSWYSPSGPCISGLAQGSRIASNIPMVLLYVFCYTLEYSFPVFSSLIYFKASTDQDDP